MLTAVFVIDGLIVLFIAVKLVQIVRRRKGKSEAPERIDLAIPEEKRLEDDSDTGE